MTQKLASIQEETHSVTESFVCNKSAIEKSHDLTQSVLDLHHQLTETHTAERQRQEEQLNNLKKMVEKIEQESNSQLQKLKKSQKTVTTNCYTQIEKLKETIIEVIEDCQKL